MDKLAALKNLLALVIDAVLVGVDASKDGKISVQDAGLLLRLIPDVGPAFQNIGDVPSELSQLDQAQADEIVAFVMGKLAIDNPKAVAIVQASLKTAESAYILVKALKA